MPTAAPQFRPASAPARQEQRRAQDKKRWRDNPYRAWYGLAAWRERKRQHLMENPLCVYCLAEGRETIGTIPNHNPPHRGNWDIFISGKLETCCKPHHDGFVQRMEQEEERRKRAQLPSIDGS